MARSFTVKQKEFITKAHEVLGEVTEITSKQIQDLVDNHSTPNPMWLKKSKYRIERGVYALPSEGDRVPDSNVSAETNTESSPETTYATVGGQVVQIGTVEEDTETYVPEVDKNYVKFGNYKDINKIIKSKKFFPVFITGMSGNGKTFGVEQACANNKREYIPVNITIETDESDLLGDLTLENGNIKWVDGPVVTAMKRGSVLLLDEIDLASNKIMALQSIIDGKGVYLKKIKKFITPKEGFTVFATANTKGRGSESGRFIGTNIMNESFLERFKITIEQSYPTPATERKILSKVFESFGVNDDEFIQKLSDWSDIIRKSFYEGAIDEIITTRRLVHIAETYSIFKDRTTSIELCINRFDDDVKESFTTLYSNLDGSINEDKNDGSINEDKNYGSIHF